MIPCVCRSPCGERGLKYHEPPPVTDSAKSLPLRGAWIEIRQSRRRRSCWRSLPLRGAWIEIAYEVYRAAPEESLPMRGAWIEI